MAPDGRAIHVRGLTVSAGSTLLLKGVDLELGPGEVLAVSGRTGAGKTTLLDALAGLSTHRLEGTMELLGEHAPAPRILEVLRRGPLGVLRQDIRGWYTPFRRIGAQVLEGWAIPREEGRHRVGALLERLALHPDRVWRQHPHALSDGMLRRVALAALLARGPRLILVDEPTAGLDGPAAWRAWEL
ncbi:MAG: ATP-binding cassette domain-containing protein, partial [Deltaproteobacteria bacterium]|nr:ATP-binding cassette domain-containing protein [Deltaproteobacteria bacterium]